MKVLSVNAAVLGGGAEKSALSLHESYLARGVESVLAVANYNAEADGVMEIPRDAYRSAWARELLRAAWRVQGGYTARPGVRATLSRGLRVAAEPDRWLRVARGHEDFDFPWTKHLLDLSPFLPDIVHLHNLHGGYFDVRALPAISAQVPTVITLHDTWLLTGHCAQPLECLRWKTGCGSCPDLKRYVPIRADKSAENLEVKRRSLLSSEVALVAPSQWMLSMAEKAGLLTEGREARVIYNGIDAEGVFVPGNLEEARARLGLPMGKKIALVVAKGAFSNPLKGFGVLSAALSELPVEVAKDLLVLVLGEDTSGQGERFAGSPVEVRGVPFASDPMVLADYYRAADVFVNPSLAESFSLVTVEAMACGIPVIASDIGGIPEIVLHGKTGICAKAGSSKEFASGLVRLLSDEGLRREYAMAGVRRVKSKFTLDRQVGYYLDYFRELCERSDSSSASHKGQ
ncbi:MAG: glycosyltransferase [Actinobacteria bacterium]|nr:glycosyltransferase [Actinomycetota bacterium]